MATPSYDQPGNTPTLAVACIRMSTDDQADSPEQQRTEIEKLAQANNYKIVAWYQDLGISGDATAKRKGFLKMREDATSSEWKVILCWDQDRFGRFDLVEAGYWILPLRNAGVRLETVCQGSLDWDTLTGQLIYNVQQVGKAQYLRDLAANVQRGKLAIAAEGKHNGVAPYGYRIGGDGRLEIVEEEAAIVRWVFETYANTESGVNAITDDLNRRKVKSAKGGLWGSSVIRRMLRRRTYK